MLEKFNISDPSTESPRGRLVRCLSPLIQAGLCFAVDLTIGSPQLPLAKTVHVKNGDTGWTGNWERNIYVTETDAMQTTVFIPELYGECTQYVLNPQNPTVSHRGLTATHVSQ
ncbi:MAG: hypothetical protein Q8P72_04990 [Candidatus Roizmanbacteria bacterium]|nr:hypothetical protein [Candidatus Roizmanbacteria bacterium]